MSDTLEGIEQKRREGLGQQKKKFCTIKMEDSCLSPSFSCILKTRRRPKLNICHIQLYKATNNTLQLLTKVLFTLFLYSFKRLFLFLIMKLSTIYIKLFILHLSEFFVTLDNYLWKILTKKHKHSKYNFPNPRLPASCLVVMCFLKLIKLSIFLAVIALKKITHSCQPCAWLLYPAFSPALCILSLSRKNTYPTPYFCRTQEGPAYMRLSRFRPCVRT